jgi:hypothetical protein
VWEVALWLDDPQDESDPVAALLDDSPLSRSQADAALRYRAAFPVEIASRIELHRHEVAAADRR